MALAREDAGWAPVLGRGDQRMVAVSGRFVNFR